MGFFGDGVWLIFDTRAHLIMMVKALGAKVGGDSPLLERPLKVMASVVATTRAGRKASDCRLPCPLKPGIHVWAQAPSS